MIQFVYFPSEINYVNKYKSLKSVDKTTNYVVLDLGNKKNYYA